MNIFPYEVGDPISSGTHLILERGEDHAFWWVALARNGFIVWRGTLAELIESLSTTHPNQETTMSEFKQYRRTEIAQIRPYVEGEVLSDRVSISKSDREAGSPKIGDMIGRNPASHEDQWLIAATYFAKNFAPL